MLELMCRRVVEVEQLGESKILMWHTTFSTEVRVVEDDSDPARLKTEFELVRSVGDMKESMYLLAYRSYIPEITLQVLHQFKSTVHFISHPDTRHLRWTKSLQQILSSLYQLLPTDAGVCRTY